MPPPHSLASLFTLLCLVINLPAATYYVDAVAGNDNNNGASAASAWKTITKVNKIRFLPGDRLLFNGGQTHSGNVSFSSNDSGTSASPVTVSSYGTGRATIYAAAGDGFKISGASYLTVTNLDISGPGWNARNDGSRGVLLTSSAHHCQADNLTITGFHKAGLRAESATHDNTISFVRAEQNGFTGIYVSGTSQRITDCQAISNNGDVTVTNNWSGSGILADNASYVTIEYCMAASNGAHQPWTGNGPVGIWCWNADHISIRHCISHHNMRGSGNADGGGFDLDGGTTDSVIEYCYSYDNAGAGYLLYNFNWQSIPHRNNTVRYCISENDRLGGFAPGSSGLPVENLSIHNNVAFNTNGSIVIRQYGGTMTNVALRNNIFATSGTLAVGSYSFILQGNCYYSTAGLYSFGSYGSNFANWANGTGKEKVNGQIVGMSRNPNLLDLGNGAMMTDPRLFTTLRSYSPASGFSPVINAGLDLQALFGINPGTIDIIGAPVPYQVLDMGAYEYQGAPLTDSVPPTVTMTAPVEGAAVAGSAVTISASAVDNTGGSGIAGVRFKLDGTDLGALDTAAPYSITWNSTLASNGLHTLSAVATDNAGNSANSTISVTVNNAAAQEVILDNTDMSNVTIIGTWTRSTNSAGYYGPDYINDGNTGKGTRSVRYTPNFQAAGAYEVFARWTAGTSRATNVPIDITTADGLFSVQVNQQVSNGVWVSLGIYNFNAGSGGNVLISNTGTNGYVIADAVRFLKQ